ncbi:MAG: hydrogenase expression/formation protein HypE [Limnochordaceae bacterium]|nr:hydrogenase expression/formation protein HypE [Limnochordaceae bacterium]
MGIGGSDRVQLAHGEGGLFTRMLETELFLPAFRNQSLAELGDAGLAWLPAAAIAGMGAAVRGETRTVVATSIPAAVAVTTDTFVVSPIQFPGGDLGKLAACGTLNDLAVAGARPFALTVGFVLEEGLPFATLEAIVHSLAAAAQQAGVPVVAGDTKVVRRGEADQLYINTTGLGYWPYAEAHIPHPGRIQAGDMVLVSGDVGRHGVAILATRAGVGFDTSVTSDVDWIGPEVAAVAEQAGWEAIHAMRDVTRGGLATVVKELALAAAAGAGEATTGLAFVLDEASISVDPAVAAAAEWLGLDPLYLPCEGRWVAVVDASAAPLALATLRQFHPTAAIIGQVVDAKNNVEGRCLNEVGQTGEVWLRTPLGSHRRLDLLAGEPQPRIC